MRRFTARFAPVALLVLAMVGANAAPVTATNSWNGYHWARTANPFTLQLGDNMTTADWKSHLAQTSSDWSKATVLDTVVVAGSSTKKRCGGLDGTVQVCNGSYGNNGWLGIAQIWLSGSHITQGVVKVNDWYFAYPSYNNKNEKEHVVCQEVGHTLGLDHQDTSGASLNTCMDYYHNTSDSDTKSTTPNQHDYDELGIIYAHLDGTTTLKAVAVAGAPAGADGQDDGDGTPPGASPERGRVYVQDLGGGRYLVTHVYWADARH